MELSTTLMKNWAVALSGSLVRAMAMVPRTLERPFFASFLMGSWVFFSRAATSFSVLAEVRPGLKPPPWIMKSGMTRWKVVPS